MNDANLKVIVSYQVAFEKYQFPTCQTYVCLDYCATYHGYWYSTSCNVISRFFCDCYNVISPNLKTNATDTCKHFWCVTCLAA